MPETVRELTFAQAVNEALAEEMHRDPRVCIFGEDVAEAGTPFKVLAGASSFMAGRTGKPVSRKGCLLTTWAESMLANLRYLPCRKSHLAWRPTGFIEARLLAPIGQIIPRPHQGRI